MSTHTYRLPQTLADDIKKFSSLAERYTNNQVSPTEFKAFRVPMGVYEQRKDEVYMARVRAAGGVITPTQLLKIIDIAERHQSDLLHLTTRQEVQIQNLKLSEVEGVLTELSREGLATKGGGGNTVRNIIVSELSGIGQETFDTTPYALELTSRLVAEADSYLLPRKMKIAFSSDESFEDYAAVNDVGFVAKIRDGRRGFKVYVGGGAGGRPSTGWLLFDFLAAEEIYTLLQALKIFFSEHGNRKNRNQARIRFIFYKNGEAETLRLIRDFFEKEKLQNHSFAVSDLTDERPVYTYQPLPEPIASADYALWKRRYVIDQRQKGYVSVLIPVVLGNVRLNDDNILKLKQLLGFVRTFGEHTVRFTNTQNIRLRNIPQEALPELFSIVKDIEATQAPLIVNNIISCTGADTCRQGICFSKGLATAIRKELLTSEITLDELASVSIHVTGCPNSCGQQLWADIGFAGRVLHNDRNYPGYQVFLAANRHGQPHFATFVGDISAHDAPKFTARLLDGYLKSSRTENFTAWLEGDGKRLALKLIDEYKNVPAFADDKNYYFDWGAEEIFTVATRGKAECSAGLFDMIQGDIANIADRRENLSTETDTNRLNQLIRDVIFSASRMLLVTRGLDPKDAAETFDFFTENFIKTGYVNAEYQRIVDLARNNADADFVSLRDEAFALADDVIELYKGMDDSLQFKKQPAVQTTDSQNETQQSHRVKDLRGVLCPMNFVKTKLELATLASGDLLEVWLDDGQPIQNVPGSVRNEGHTVLEQTPRPDGTWKVLIQKK